jgi:uncharacterized membrane protein
MFGGLFVDVVGSLAGIPNPLSLSYLVGGISVLFIILFVFSNSVKSSGEKTYHFDRNKNRLVLQVSLFAVLLVSGLVGSIYRDVFVLAIMLAFIAVIFFLCTFFDGFLAPRLYPLVIAVVSIVILFSTVLISKHLFGADVFREFYVFKLTDTAGYWQPSGQIVGYTLIESLNSLLSVTILPLVLSVLLGIDGELIFKIFYPLVLALIPISIYALCTRQLTKKIGLIAAFYFMSISIAFCGIEQFSINRQIVGQLYFFLSFLVIIEWKRFPSWRNRVLLLIFVSALTVSHYSLAFLFVLFIASLLCLSRVWAAINRARAKRTVSTSTAMTLGLFLLLFSTILFWYTFVCSSPLNQLSDNVNRISRSFFQDFFSAESRSQEGALDALSPIAPSGILGTIHKIVIYIGQLLMVLGVLSFLIKAERFSSSSDFGQIGIISLAVLGFGFLIPNLFDTLNTSRFYSIVLPFLSPFFLVGACFLFDCIVSVFRRFRNSAEKHRAKDIGLKAATIVLVLTFVFQTGLINHIANDYPYSYSLDLGRKLRSEDLSIQVGAYSQYILEGEVVSAEWLLSRGNRTAKIYADYYSQNTVLTSYALVERDRMFPITNDTMLSNTYTYLTYTNVNLGLFDLVNKSDFASISRNSNSIYSNGDSNIYSNP